MGFMRKALFLGTGGASGLVIKANSKKERTAMAAEKQVRLQKQMLKGQQAAVRAAAPPPAPLASLTKRPPTPSARPPRRDQVNWAPIVSALANLNLTEQTREANRWTGGIPAEGDLELYSSNLRLVIFRFTNGERAHQAASALEGRSDLQGAMSSGHSAVRAVDRMLYVADGRGGPVDESRVDDVARVVGEIVGSNSTEDGGQPAAGPAAEIEHLAQLHVQGALTDEEFTAGKAKILDMPG